MQRATILTIMRFASLFAIAIVAAGCVSPLALEPAPNVSVERIPSSRFEFDLIQVYSQPEGIWVRGEVSRKLPQRGAIPGSVHLSLIGPEGAILSEVDASLMRRNRQARSAHFDAVLPVTPPPGSTLKVEHVVVGPLAG